VDNLQTLLLEISGPVATIKLNRPEALNALNSVVVREMVSLLSKLEGDDSVRCVVLTGSDKAFCAGADVREMAELSREEMANSDHLAALWERAASFEKPMIAALSGYALGGGLELAMCCDIIVASEGTKLGQPEINVGIIPGGGGTQRLPRAVGKYKAMEMILTGGSITAEEARAIGLVNRIVPAGEYLEEATKLAVEISSKPPLAVRAAKKAVMASQDLGLSQGLEAGLDLFHDLFATEDQKEGMSAFLEKRKPIFKGS
jgi:enoyl-CoA hydratase